MRVAAPTELTVPTEIVLLANVSADALRRVLPLELESIETFAEAEPSRGALLRLRNGDLVMVSWGEITQTLTLYVPTDADPASITLEFLLETGLEAGAIRWLRPDVLAALQPLVSEKATANASDKPPHRGGMTVRLPLSTEQKSRLIAGFLAKFHVNVDLIAPGSNEERNLYSLIRSLPALAQMNASEASRNNVKK